MEDVTDKYLREAMNDFAQMYSRGVGNYTEVAAAFSTVLRIAADYERQAQLEARAAENEEARSESCGGD